MEPLYPKESFRALKILILCGLSVTILSTLYPQFFFSFFSLSAPCLKKGWVWQFIFHPFVSCPIEDSMYLSLLQWLGLGALGSALLIRHGEKYFIPLLLGSILSPTIAALPFMNQTAASLSGLAPLLFAFSTAWSLQNTTAHTQLFSRFSCRGCFIIFAALAIDLSLHLFRSDLMAVASRVGGGIFAYLYVKATTTPDLSLPKNLLSEKKIYDIQSGYPIFKDK